MFSERGCKVCYRVRTVLLPKASKKLGVEYSFKELLADKHLKKFKALSKKYKFNHRALPVLFISNKILTGRIRIEKNLEKILSDYKAGKFKNIDVLKEISSTDLNRAKINIEKNFKKWSLGSIIGAGLIDGINPCAFATIIFLISYLAFAGRKKREVAIIGSIFTLAVFLTYMLVGVIFYDLIDRLRSAYNVISTIIFYLTLLLCLGFAVFTLYDLIKAFKKKSNEMKLTLPKKLKQKIHKVIREHVKMKNLVISSIIIGFLVSLFELACTGQVYLPTIMFILHKSTLKTTGFFYLLIYNLAFILPLLIIFLLNLMGVSSEKMQNFLHKHLALTKLLLLILFLGLATYLIIERFLI